MPGRPGETHLGRSTVETEALGRTAGDAWRQEQRLLTCPTYRPLVSLAGNKNMLINSIRMLGAALEVFAEYTSHL